MRSSISINQNWRFKKEQASPPNNLPDEWEEIDLPFTWNGKDGQDGGNDYYRGKCCFVRALPQIEFPAGEEIYLQFDGVNASADVYFNGTQIAVHHGGYSTFRVKLPEVRNRNLLAVIVDNGVNDSVYPQVADFTFYGGIYRDVKLIGVSKHHFDMDYYGSSGIWVTPEIKNENADVKVEARITNGDGCTVRYSVFDGESVVAQHIGLVSQEPVYMTIEDVHRWNGRRDPHLYTLKAELLAGEEIADTLFLRFGCRSFEIDPQRGFLLNGEEYPLRGVSRHQDRPEIGNALTKEHHREDMDLICEIGANTIRLAHYQHAQEFYDLCDERGMVVWAEIPYISEHMSGGVENTKLQLKELILQNYNHPSIVVWGISNEITMHSAPRGELLENHRILNALAHQLDPTRSTTLAVLSMCDPDEPYVHCTDVVSYNHYFGWYGGSPGMYKPWFDRFHKKYPDKAIGISEYGCEALNWHSSTPTQGDYTEEYQALYHEELIKQIMDMPYLWATHVWNMFDFAADARAEGGENGMNHKGLVTFDRKYKKDSFYAYKAWLSGEPFVHICGKRYVRHAEEIVRVTVYSNQEEVSLWANGNCIGTQRREKYPFFYFEVKNEGRTVLTVKAGECSDSSVIEKVDAFDESYRMKEEGAVLNWFDITAPDGYFSINDTVGAVMKTMRGKLLLLSMIGDFALSMLKKKHRKPQEKGSVPGKRFPINRTTLELAKGFSVKRLITMFRAKITKQELLDINRRLNQIRKPETSNKEGAR